MRKRGKVWNYVTGKNNWGGNPSIIYEDNQGAIFLAKNRQVGICTKRIDICHRFLQDMVEEKDIDIQYIQSEDNPVAIMTEKIL